MHATVSGCGDNLAVDDEDAIEQAKLFFSYLPTCWREPAARRRGRAAAGRADRRLACRPTSRCRSTCTTVIDGLVDADSFFEIKPLFAAELIIGFGRIDGRPVGIVANNSAVRGGVLFVDSADKAARFIWLCDAFNVPLLYLADVPGFMIGSEVERQGIIRHGAKMITAVVRGDRAAAVGDRAQGLRRRAVRDGRPGLHARRLHRAADRADRGDGPAGRGQRRLRQQDRRDRRRRRAGRVRRRPSAPSTRQDVDLLRLAADLVIDAIIEPSELRAELVRRYAVLVGKSRHFATKRHGVPPT